MTERTIVPPNLFAIGDVSIVEPIYDPDQLGSIIIPQEAKNPQAQQGIVLSAGPEAPYPNLSHILFEPYNAAPFYHDQHEYLAVPARIVIGEYRDNTVYPRSDSVIIEPEFGPIGATKIGSIITLARVFENPPVQTGTVVRCGSDVKTLHAGDHVLVPPTSGHEVGLDIPDFRGVFYFLPESSILAILPNEQH